MYFLNDSTKYLKTTSEIFINSFSNIVTSLNMIDHDRQSLAISIEVMKTFNMFSLFILFIIFNTKMMNIFRLKQIVI